MPTKITLVVLIFYEKDNGASKKNIQERKWKSLIILWNNNLTVNKILVSNQQVCNRNHSDILMANVFSDLTA